MGVIVGGIMAGFLAKSLIDAATYYRFRFPRGDYEHREFYEIGDKVPRWQAVAGEAANVFLTDLLSEMLSAWAGGTVAEFLLGKWVNKLREFMRKFSMEEDILKRRRYAMSEADQRGDLCPAPDLDPFATDILRATAKDESMYEKQLRRLSVMKEAASLGLFLVQLFEWGLEYLFWAGKLVPAVQRMVKEGIIEFIRFINNLPRQIDLTDPDMRELVRRPGGKRIAEILERRNRKSEEVIMRMRRLIEWEKARKKWAREREKKLKGKDCKRLFTSRELDKLESFGYMGFEYKNEFRRMNAWVDIPKVIHRTHHGYGISFYSSYSGCSPPHVYGRRIVIGPYEFSRDEAGDKANGIGVFKFPGDFFGLPKEFTGFVCYRGNDAYYRNSRSVNNSVVEDSITERSHRLEGGTVSREDAWFWVRALQRQEMVSKEEASRHLRKVVDGIKKRYNSAIDRRKRLSEQRINGWKELRNRVIERYKGIVDLYIQRMQEIDLRQCVDMKFLRCEMQRQARAVKLRFKLAEERRKAYEVLARIERGEEGVLTKEQVEKQLKHMEEYYNERISEALGPPCSIDMQSIVDCQQDVQAIIDQLRQRVNEIIRRRNEILELINRKIEEETRKAQDKIKEYEEKRDRLIDEVMSRGVSYDEIYTGIFLSESKGKLWDWRFLDFIATKWRDRENIDKGPCDQPGVPRANWQFLGWVNDPPFWQLFFAGYEGAYFSESYLWRYSRNKVSTMDRRGKAHFFLGIPRNPSHLIPTLPDHYSTMLTPVAVVWKRFYRKRSRKLKSSIVYEASVVVQNERTCKRIKKRLVKDRVRSVVIRNGWYMWEKSEQEWVMRTTRHTSMNPEEGLFIRQETTYMEDFKQIYFASYADEGVTVCMYDKKEHVIYIYEVIFTDAAIKHMRGTEEREDQAFRIVDLFDPPSPPKKPRTLGTKRKKIVCT